MISHKFILIQLIIFSMAVLIIPESAIETSKKPPQKTPQKLKYPFGAIKSVPVHEKVVALTYDDGPNPVFTTKLLKILDKYHIKATFFMVGTKMEQYPEIVKEVMERGHCIANHTYTHPLDLKKDTDVRIKEEIYSCGSVIEQMTGKRPYLFRPPKGLVGGDVVSMARDAGYKTILWTVSADHHDAPTPDLMARRVVAGIKPGGIILAHDGMRSDRWKDVAATPKIIESLLKQGYKFVTVENLLAMKPEEHVKEKQVSQMPDTRRRSLSARRLHSSHCTYKI